MGYSPWGRKESDTNELTHSFTWHSHVFIFSASLCLLVGAFNPFTFKVIIDMYDPITNSLIVLGLFSVSLFFVCFLLREVRLAFAIKLV